MRKEILHELYKYKDDYEYHDLAPLIKNIIGNGDELIIGGTLTHLSSESFVHFKGEYKPAPGQVSINQIGGGYAGQVLSLSDFSIFGRILYKGIKEVESDILIASTDATNESLRITNKSIQETNISTQKTNESIKELNQSTITYYTKTNQYYEATKRLTINYLGLVALTALFILGQLIFSVLQWKSENSTKTTLQEVQSSYIQLQKQVRYLDSSLQTEKKNQKGTK